MIKEYIPSKVKTVSKAILINSRNILINLLVVVISFFIPKSKEYVIVGGWGGKRYADNSRAFYEYLIEKKIELGIKKIFWYTKDKSIHDRLRNNGFDVLCGVNLKSIYWHFRSGVHITDWSPVDILYFFSVRCIRINLWHGIPLKKVFNYIHEDNITYVNKWNKICSLGFWKDQYILAPSEWAGEILRFAFGLQKEKCLIASYPRNRKLYKNIYDGKKKDKCTVFYLPTFRNNKSQNPFLNCNLEELNRELAEHNIQVLFKLHFADKPVKKKMDELSNIKLLETEVDAYEWLDKTDLLVTDYSSVYYDFTITNKPILFYPYDYEYYKDNDRGFIVSYEEYTPGEKVFELDELIKLIFYVAENYEEYRIAHSKQYEVIRKKVNKYLTEPNYDELKEIWLNKRFGKKGNERWGQ